MTKKISVIVKSSLSIAFLIFGFSSPAFAQSVSNAIISFELTGTVGPYRIGLYVMTRNYNQFVGGHYFYASHLINIPLEGRIDGKNVILEEPNGGVFKLQFVKVGSVKGQPLNFYYCNALQGQWIKSNKSLPVNLKIAYSAPSVSNAGGDWYAGVTNEPDADFEALVQRFRHGVITGNRAEAASAVSYPLTVNSQTVTVYSTEASFLAHWNDIFTPKYIAALRETIPHEMFVHEGEAMLGDGEVWFDAKGASALNVF
jgi:hypothetical protein